MGIKVYADGRSIACKAADGKSAAAMPDVCLSPPSPPAGPVPIPYPNTAMASDTTDGSTTVQIGGQEVMLKNQSTFKKSSGDEAATKSLGMGVVTHQIQGALAFISWSFDVKFEGANVPRHLDLTGHNEASDPPNTPPFPYVDTASPPAPIVWPPNDGCSDTPTKTTLKKGDKIDRYGYDGGKFTSPVGIPFGARSLAPGTAGKPYSVFEVQEDIEVETCTIAPWFGEPGGGKQYKMPSSIEDLLKSGKLVRA